MEQRKIVIVEKNGKVYASFYCGDMLINEKSVESDICYFTEYAKKAFDKLFESDPEIEESHAHKLLNTKIFVIDGYEDMKSGRIYEIKDGKINCDGWEFPIEGDFYSMKDVHKYFDGKNSIKFNSVGKKMGGFSTKKQVKVMEVKEDD